MCGYLLVILPTTVLLFIPLLYVILPGVTEAVKYPLRLLGAMAGGLLLAFIYYRVMAPRWVRWAVMHAADLRSLKRKMRVSRLLPDGLLVRMSHSSWLPDEVRQQLQAADHRKAAQDNLAVPVQVADLSNCVLPPARLDRYFPVCRLGSSIGRPSALP